MAPLGTAGGPREADVIRSVSVPVGGADHMDVTLVVPAFLCHVIVAVGPK
jgi:hypothetical protein